MDVASGSVPHRALLLSPVLRGGGQWTNTSAHQYIIKEWNDNYYTHVPLRLQYSLYCTHSGIYSITLIAVTCMHRAGMHSNNVRWHEIKNWSLPARPHYIGRSKRPQDSNYFPGWPENTDRSSKLEYYASILNYTRIEMLLKRSECYK